VLRCAYCKAQSPKPTHVCAGFVARELGGRQILRGRRDRTAASAELLTGLVVVIGALESALTVAWIKFLKIRILKLCERLDGGEEALCFRASAVGMAARE